MSLQANLKGRLRITSLLKSHGLIPVFEVVVNSIHSIEKKKEIPIKARLFFVSGV